MEWRHHCCDPLSRQRYDAASPSGKSSFKEMTEILDRQYQLPTQKYFTKMALPNTYKVRKEVGGLSVFFFLTNNRNVVQCLDDTIHSDSALYFT